MPSAGGPVGAAGMCTGAPGSAGWLPIRVTFRWLSASSGCSSTFCRQVLGSVCTGPTAVTPPSPRSPRGSLQPRRHTLCCGHQLPIGPRGQLPQPVQRLRVPAPRSSGIAHGFSSPGHFGVFRSAWQGRAASLCVPGTRPGTAGSQRVGRSCVQAEEAGGAAAGASTEPVCWPCALAAGGLGGSGALWPVSERGHCWPGLKLLLPQGCPYVLVRPCHSRNRSAWPEGPFASLPGSRDPPSRPSIPGTPRASHGLPASPPQGSPSLFSPWAALFVPSLCVPNQSQQLSPKLCGPPGSLDIRPTVTEHLLPALQPQASSMSPERGRTVTT